MRAIRVVMAAAILAACLQAPPARGTAFSTDQSDLWWVPTESGWGIQLVQRGSIIFATMFVYGPAGTPAWYVATLNAAGPLSWTGDLVVTKGTWFGNPVFTPLAPGDVRKVGPMTWSASSTTAGTLDYTVDGVRVVKSIVRQFITFDDFSGTFLGAIHQTATSCTNPAKNGTVEDFATATFTQNGTAVSLALALQTGVACMFSGTLAQDGRFGTASGTANCGGGPQTLVLSTMTVGFNSIYVHYDAGDNGNGCLTSGYFAGARHR